MQEIRITGYNNLSIFTRVYDNVKNPKAVIQIIHGMHEHSLRYDRFARMLNNNGFIVIAPDSRGHGYTAKTKEELGYGEKDIFVECVEDHSKVSEYIKEKYNLPLYIFAHSWGSMIAQRLIQVNHIAEKVILCGTNIGSDPSFHLGKLVTNIQSWFINDKKPANFITKINNNLYQKKFVRGNWLTRDEEIFDKYIADPLCTAPFPISFYKSLFNNMTKVNRKIKNIRKDIKLFLIAGDKDPVGNYSKNVLKLAKLFKKHKLNTTTKIYENARHELVNEINKNEVDQDIVNFFNI